mgnify:CR=1 FL=1
MGHSWGIIHIGNGKCRGIRITFPLRIFSKEGNGIAAIPFRVRNGDGSHPVGDVHIGAAEEVDLEVLEGQDAVLAQPRQEPRFVLEAAAEQPATTDSEPAGTFSATKSPLASVLAWIEPTCTVASPSGWPVVASRTVPATVPEVIVARAMGVRCFGVSCLTNLAAGIQAEPLHHEEVMETTERVGGQFRSLVRAVVARIQPALER